MKRIIPLITMVSALALIAGCSASSGTTTRSGPIATFTGGQGAFTEPPFTTSGVWSLESSLSCPTGSATPGVLKISEQQSKQTWVVTQAVEQQVGSGAGTHTLTVSIQEQCTWAVTVVSS